MGIELSLSSDRNDRWYVTINGTYVVGFLGPEAHQLAMRQRQELAELLNPTARADDDRARPYETHK